MLRPRPAVVLLVAVGCAGRASPPSSVGDDPASRSDAAALRRAPPEGQELTIPPSADTRSPSPRRPLEDLSDLEPLCGEPDRRLDSVAGALATFRPLGRDSSDVDRLTFALRAAGTPYVRPVAWSQSWTKTSPPSNEVLRADFHGWLATLEPAPVRRCGFARLDDGGSTRLVVVAAQALAELSVPLPAEVRVGQWLDFRAELLMPAIESHVLLLGPEGEPQMLPTSQQGSTVRARFAARSPGKWLVQLLSTGETGPRPMLEAVLYADVARAPKFVAESAPGEARVPLDGPEVLRLERFVAATRAETGRPPLRRDPTLDALAAVHAAAMRRAQRVGHDIGTGSTRERLTQGRAQARLSGENVVHAADALRAHRALWSSPSHRTNLLHRGFSRWGLGVATDVDGSLWVCELFASID